ncbi:MAG TPA: histidine phosphatase family protein [Gaiellaceae bacterium]|nr:histidine phosphatase family protein [Gaiellaceae bacterium]
MIELGYETHSLTTDNEHDIATGWLPGELSADGRRQAISLGQRRADVSAVFASDLRRAVETVEIAFAGSSVPVLLDWRLRECDYGRLNGAPAATLDRAAHVEDPFPEGESYRDVVARTAAFIADVRGRWSGRRICVVSHSANLWALQHLVHGARLEEVVAAPFEWREGWEFRL